MEKLTSAVIVATLVVWLAATLMNAASLGESVLGRLGMLRTFVPVWNFFAPNPGVHDFHLLTRERLDNGEVTRWRQDMLFERPRSLLTCLWNPHKIERKILYDLTLSLVREIADLGDDLALIKISIPYLVFASYAETLPHPPDAVGVQFMLMRSSAIEPEAEIVFVSEVHLLG
jgi:hypothetical protein